MAVLLLCTVTAFGTIFIFVCSRSIVLPAVYSLPVLHSVLRYVLKRKGISFLLTATIKSVRRSFLPPSVHRCLACKARRFVHTCHIYEPHNVSYVGIHANTVRRLSCSGNVSRQPASNLHYIFSQPVLVASNPKDEVAILISGIASDSHYFKVVVLLSLNITCLISPFSSYKHFMSSLSWPLRMHQTRGRKEARSIPIRNTKKCYGQLS